MASKQDAHFLKENDLILTNTPSSTSTNKEEKPNYFSFKSTSTKFYFRFWYLFLDNLVLKLKHLFFPKKKVIKEHSVKEDENEQTLFSNSFSFWNLFSFGKIIQLLKTHLMNLFLITLSIVLMVILFFLSISIWKKFHFKRLLFAYYPIILYFLLSYGSQILVTIFVYFGQQAKEEKNQNKSHFKTVDSSYSFHINLKSNLKRILFRAFECSFYSAFFPFGFIPEYVFYDKIRCIISALYIIFNTCFILYLQFCWNNRYKLMYHVRFVGGWEKIHSKSILAATYTSHNNNNSNNSAVNGSSNSTATVATTTTTNTSTDTEKLVSMSDLSKIESEIQDWNKEMIPYGRASIVKCDGTMYLAMGDHNVEMPTDFDSTILTRLYGRPDKAHATFVYIQALITITQLLFLNSTYWDSIVMTLFFNYYIMYWCVGFWIEWKHLFNTFSVKKK